MQYWFITGSVILILPDIDNMQTLYMTLFYAGMRIVNMQGQDIYPQRRVLLYLLVFTENEYNFAV